MTTAISDLELPPGYYTDRWRGTGAWCTLPWPAEVAEKSRLLRESLGPLVIAWAHGELTETHGPGLTDYRSGLPWRFTPGQQRYLILWYAYDPGTGRWRYRRGVKRGAKGTGKDPFGGSLCLCELLGPTHLVWRDGRWDGEAHGMPLVQIAANSEAQGKDVLRVANTMLGRDAREHYGIDCGETRTYLTDGGRLELLTFSEASSEGDPATFIFLNESHHMTESSGGHRIAKVARRNVGKSPKDVQARLVEATNAHQQGADSVAERSYEAWQLQVSGRARRRDILYDSIEAPPHLSLLDDDQRRAGIVAAYMDAPWSDHERTEDEILDPDTTPAEAVRYYWNGLADTESAWTDPRAFDILARERVVADGEQIAMFLDCSKSTDATGLLGCRISDGFVFVLGCWQRPHGDRGKGWLVPRHEVDVAGRAAFERYDVVWCGADPSPARDDTTEAEYWMQLLDGWHRDFRDTVAVWATPGQGDRRGHAVLFDMRVLKPGGQERNRMFVEAAEQTARDIEESAEQTAQGVEEVTLTYNGDVRLRQHTHNARQRPTRWGMSLGKASRGSSKLVDLAVCMVGARMGRRIALNSGKLKRRRRKGVKREAVFV